MSEIRAVEKPEQDYVFSLIPSEHVPFVWPQVHDMLLEAVKRADGRWSMKSLLYALVTGEQMLWVAYETAAEGHGTKAALTTQIAQYPHLRMVSIHFLGGSGFDEWGDDWMKTIERYARDMQCDGVEAMGRFGFKKFMKRNDFESGSVLYTKVFGFGANERTG